MREQAGFLEYVANRPLVGLSKSRWGLPDLTIDRAKTSGQVVQAGQTARDRGLAATGRTKNRCYTGGRSGEACVQRKCSDLAAERNVNSAGAVRGVVHRHGRTPALRFSISIIVRITAKAKITMPPARMLASRQRDAST